jgi:hypothetical protein
MILMRGCWLQARVKNKSKRKVQNANGKATARTAIIQKSRSWDFTFAFCDLPFDLFFRIWR